MIAKRFYRPREGLKVRNPDALHFPHIAAGGEWLRPSRNLARLVRSGDLIASDAPPEAAPAPSRPRRDKEV